MRSLIVFIQLVSTVVNGALSTCVLYGTIRPLPFHVGFLKSTIMGFRLAVLRLLACLCLHPYTFCFVPSFMSLHGGLLRKASTADDGHNHGADFLFSLF